MPMGNGKVTLNCEVTPEIHDTVWMLSTAIAMILGNYWGLMLSFIDNNYYRYSWLMYSILREIEGQKEQGITGEKKKKTKGGGERAGLNPPFPSPPPAEDLARWRGRRAGVCLLPITKGHGDRKSVV